MRYKENWEQAKERHKAFWNQEIIDRCCVSLMSQDPTAQMEACEYRPKDEAGIFQFWTDPEWIIKRNRARFNRTTFLAESLPILTLNLGAAGHAGFYKGMDFKFTNTVWFPPGLNSLEQMEFDENSFLYKKTLELAKAFAEDAKGEYLVSMSDCCGNIDALSHLIGPEELMPLMLEDPDIVQDAMKKMQWTYEKIHRETHDILKTSNEGGGVVGWLQTWAPGMHMQMQSDMSVMFSADMYDEFIRPELEAQCAFLDYPLYHFDGVEQIRHLDILLSIDKLKAIQWTPCASQPPVTEYIPELKKIQAAGKSLIIQTRPDQIRPLMENLSSKGLYLLIGTHSPEDCDEIMKLVTKLTHE